MSAAVDSLSHVEVNGVNLAYRESGNGEPLVLVHPHLSDHRSWTALEGKLSGHFRVYNYSRRFAWPNEPIRDSEPQPWEQDSLDLAAFIETLDIGPVHALGNSSGSTVILWLALMFYGATTIGPAIELSKKGDYDRALSTFGSGCLGPKYWPRLLQDPERKKQMDDSAKCLLHFLRYNSLPVYTTEDARQIQVPTLVLTGADGPYFQQCIDAELVRVCGAKKKCETIIPAAGHLMHEDNPEGVYKAILKFMKDDLAAQ